MTLFRKGSFQFRSKSQTIFDSDLELGLTAKPFGSWDWLIPYAMPERAFLGMLSGIQEEADFETADRLFEGAGTLRPDLLQQLLVQVLPLKDRESSFTEIDFTLRRIGA